MTELLAPNTLPENPFAIKFAGRTRTPVSSGQSLSLPFDTKTVLRSYLYSAYPAGILSAGRGIPAIVLSYHVQLFFPDTKLTDVGRNRAHFRFFPGMGFDQFAALGCFRISQHEVDSPGVRASGELVQLTRACLEKGHVVFIYIDEYFVPGTKCHSVRHHRHPLLIVGCDESSKELIGVTYRADEQLGTVKVSFGSYIEGIYSRAGRITGRYHDATVFKEIAVAEGTPDRFDGKAYLERLASYYTGSDDSARYLSGGWSVPNPETAGQVYWDVPSTEGAFGISIYAAWKKYLTAVMTNRVDCDMRATRVLMDHKELMTRALALIFGTAASSGAVASGCAQLRQLATAIHQNAFLWNRMKGEPIGRQMLSAVEQLEAKEKDLLELVLAERGRL
jgi:hypothetical protein